MGEYIRKNNKSLEIQNNSDFLNLGVIPPFIISRCNTNDALSFFDVTLHDFFNLYGIKRIFVQGKSFYVKALFEFSLSNSFSKDASSSPEWVTVKASS